VIPYWKQARKFRARPWSAQTALEMHPGFVVYNPDDAAKAPEKAVGEELGANCDLSLFLAGL